MRRPWVSPDPELLEIARLRAEVERLTRGWQATEKARLLVVEEREQLIKALRKAQHDCPFEARMRQERDETLAQVAVLARAAQEVADNHESGFSCQDGVAGKLPEILSNLPAEAHALLDRLRRAEAVVEAFKPIYEGARCLHCNGKILEHDSWCVVRLKAAWEEGK